MKRLPTPASSPWCAVPGKSWSIAWRISWSPPLHGRLEPAVAIARPERTSASASAIRNVVVLDAVLAVQTAVAAVRAKVTASAVDGLAALAPRPAASRRSRRGWRRRRRCPSGASRGSLRAHVVEVDDDRDRHLHAVGAPCGRRARARTTGEAMPSWARLVATATIGRPAERRGVLGHVERPAAADADERVEGARAQPRARAPRRLDRAALDRAEVGVLELRAQRRGDLLALPGPDGDRDVAAARDPPVGEQRREAGDGARADVDGEGRRDHAASAAARDLPRAGEVGVVVDLDPVDAADRRDADAPAAVGELLEAVLVVEPRVALPGGLERVGQPRRPPRARSA